MIDKLARFLRDDIWRIRIRQLPRSKYFLFKPLRIALLALRGFAEDKCQLRASALTFYTLLSLVPVLAMAFGIAKGFGFDEQLSQILTQRFETEEAASQDPNPAKAGQEATEKSEPGETIPAPSSVEIAKEAQEQPGQGKEKAPAGAGDDQLRIEQQQVIEWIVDYANNLLAGTRGGLIAGIGIVILLWTVITLLSNIEHAFNQIWGIRKGRTLTRKISDYLSIMLICPFLLIASNSLTVYLTSRIREITEATVLLDKFNFIVFYFLKLIPYFMLWILFAFVYVIMPNTRVRFKAGLVAGILAGTVYYILQWTYIHFQIGVAKYDAIYGGFAAVPLLLIWLQISWMVVLFGAEVSFAVDNEETYEFERDCLGASVYFKRLVALRISEMCVKSFLKGEEPLTATHFAQAMEVPIRLAREVLYNLVDAGILSEIKTNDENGGAYHPAQDIAQLTLRSVTEALDKHGVDTAQMVKREEIEKVSAALESLDRLASQAPQNTLLKDL